MDKFKLPNKTDLVFLKSDMINPIGLVVYVSSSDTVEVFFFKENNKILLHVFSEKFLEYRFENVKKFFEEDKFNNIIFFMINRLVFLEDKLDKVSHHGNQDDIYNS